jgi:hypothetical protein
MTDRSTVGGPGTLTLSPSVILRPATAHDERPASPSGVSSADRLPRDVMVRLAALSRKVGAIREEHADDADLSVRLTGVVAGLDGLIQRIYDEVAQVSSNGHH